MAHSIDTDELRQSAQEWNLEGDRKLLNLLQNLHKNITSRCMETGNRLSDMFTSLDHAKVSMDNVNNRFMSLSNTQFVESRVYEEDSEFKTPPQTVKQPTPEADNKSSPLQKLTAALLAIENSHERVTILEDTDSDTDDEGASVILRPKDVYQMRPLPFIIGSQSWKNKWHAGLIAEDSDTESIVSNKDEDLSQSDESVAMSAPNIHADANSFRSVSPTSLPAQDDLYKPDMSRNYQPYAAANTAPQAYLFVDEPPPMTNDSDATTEPTESDTDDIFAELHKDVKHNSHKTNVNKENQSSVDKKDMFPDNRGVFPDNSGAFPDNREIFPELHKELKNKSHKTNINKESQSNFDRKDISIDYREKTTPDDDEISYRDDNEIDKKPTGGVSLFGTKTVAESIGAAILKRNQRKSSSSEDDDERTNNQAKTTQFNRNISKNNNESKDTRVTDNKTIKENVKNTDINNPAQNVIEQLVNRQNKNNKQVVVTENNIFDELFAKSKQNTSKSKEDKVNVKKVDVFSDIFDDIDDLFTSDDKINKSSSKNTKKSVFDDDLFSDSVQSDVKDKTKLTKSIFDDDNDLFNEPVITSGSINTEKSQKNISNNKIATKEVESFTNNKTVLKTDESVEKTTLFNDTDIFKIEANDAPITKKTLKNPRQENKKLTSIFDSDSDGDDIFSVIKAPELKKSEISNKKTDIFGGISEATDNSTLLNKNMPTDSKSNINYKNQKTETRKHNESFKDDINEDDSENLLKKTTETTSQDLDTESNKSVTDTNANTLEITKAKPSQNNNDKLPQNYVNREDIQCDSVKIDEKMSFEPKNLNTEPSALKSASYMQTPNSNSSNQMSSNDSKISIDDCQDTATKHIKINSDINKDNRKTPNEINTSDIPNTVNIQSNIPKTIDNNETTYKKVLEKEIFEDIFPEEPPELEKAKETKSNQNVNALFGDDSEDENLFFKKETLISDEKPDTSQITPVDPLFGVFTDEPPDFDDDFLFKKPTHSSEVIIKSVDVNNKEFLFSDSPKTKDEVAKKDNDKESKDISTMAKSQNRTVFDDDDTLLLMQAKPDPTKESSTIYSNDSLFDTKSTKNQEETDGNTVEPKTIGKLKPINFNINVTNILPGASPKKIVKADPQLPIEESLTDGGLLTKPNEIVSNKSTDNAKTKYTPKDVPSIDTEKVITEPSIVKSVSFDSDPESAVLDNKISKQRARIQVKRRPSTRRARKDAVRKSVIDIDTVDSNFENDEDISPKTADDQELKDSKIGNILPNVPHETLVDCNFENIPHKTGVDNLTSSSFDKYQSIKSTEGKTEEISKENVNLYSEGTSDRSVDSNDDSIDIFNTQRDIITKLNLKQETTSERAETKRTESKDKKDVFKDIGQKSPEKSIEKYMEQDSSCIQKDGTQVLNINEDDIYIFREPKTTKTELVETKITTLGQVYPEHKAKDISKTEKDRSIFDDDDDLLFSVGITETTKSAVKSSISEQNSSLFSQSKSKNLHSTKSVINDDDFFSTSNTNKETPKTTKSQIKPSIFDEENEELFSSSSNTKPPKKLMKKSLFDDLSDDDDDLFGGNFKTITKTLNKSSDGLFSSKQSNIEAKSLKSTLFDEDTKDLFGSTSKGEKETKRLPSKAAVPKETKESGETFDDPLSMFNYN